MARVLYKMDGSPAARTVMMVIDLLGLETEMRDLNPLLREQDQPEFAKAPTYSGRMTEIPRYNKLLLEDAYKILEEYLSQTLYVADDVMTIADISVFTTVCSLDGLHPVDEKRFPKLKRWIKTMSEKDVCKRINEEGSKMHVFNLKMKMELNKEEQEEKKQSKAKL